MGLLDTNRFFVGAPSVFTANESISIATANSAVKTIPAKAGYNCVAINVSLSDPAAVMCVRIGNSSLMKLLLTDDGEIHYAINYYNNLSFLAGVQNKTYYVHVDGNEEIRLFNRIACSGQTAAVTIKYLVDYPSQIETLKPRQVLYRATKTFGASDSSFNLTIQSSIEDEVSLILKHFKFVSVEMKFLNSSNALKSVSGTFKLIGRLYTPFSTNNVSSPALMGSGAILIDKAISNEAQFVTDWVEVKGLNLRYETSLGTTVTEGDQVALNIIGIR